ncbi:MAG TPA: SDR family oxidoreductase [Chitinophagales bacterium]|nr:SDR family oxidoreductase [Chitinophagales bacterium]
MYDVPFHQGDLSGLRFLVTGGAGFIGSHLVEYLLRYKAAKVVVLDNLLTGQRSNVALFKSNDRYEFIHGDICNPDDCERACAGIDYVLHQAALGSVPRSIKDPQATNRINIDGFLNIIVAARDANVKRFIYASSSSVYGDHAGLPKVEDKTGKPLSPYAVTKAANEMYARVFADVYGMEIIGLRYFNIFGPRQDPNGPYAAVIPLFISLLKNQQPPPINGDGQQTRDFTFVANAVQANVKAAFTTKQEALGKVYNVAVGENFTLLDLTRCLNDVLGTNVEPVHREDRPGDIRNSLADISLAQKLLDYRPTVRFKEGLAYTAAAFATV